MADRTGISVNRSTMALLFGAILLPSLIFVALQFGFGYRAERRAIETTTLANADTIMAEIDGNMQRTRASALALASAATVKQGNWPEAYDRARELAKLNYDWKSVRLIDIAKGVEIFDLSRPFGSSQPIGGVNPDTTGFARQSLIFNGIQRDGPGCPCLAVQAPVRRGRVVRYIVSILLDPAAFQKELLAHAPVEGTSAVVDANGNFIARTRDWPQRAGLPATQFVRDAIRHGKRGIYCAVTYEGLPNYTAFTTSSITGWSAHVALPRARFDAPLFWSHFASTIALVISLALAVGLVWALMHVIAGQRSAELRVQQAQRLEAVGKMTGGVAHDFNNMLAIVIGSLDIVRRRRAAGRDDIDRFIDNAMDGANRAADLTRRLLAFSRRQTLAPIATDINILLEDMRHLVERTIDESVALQYDLTDGIWCALIDPGQLENAVVNLAVNARDAMPHGGRIVLRSRNVSLAPAEAAKLDLSAGHYVVASLSDDGEGMTEYTLRRAFEPFFTTKEVGRGTGLGLSQIYGFLDQSGGRAVIDSKQGFGTTIDLYLPRYNGEPANRCETDLASPSLPPGSADEIILVTEDEDQVRSTNVEALRELGYSVRHAANGPQALAILSSQPGVKLLFTDIVMPGMNGRELAAEAKRRLPDLKLLFVTGYDRVAGDGADLDAGEEVLRKPFAMDQLARKVREVLDR